MPKCNKSNFNHVLYNYNRARVKSGEKIKNAIEHHLTLQKRVAVEGETKWLKMAFLKSNAKLKRYGVTAQMVENKKNSKPSATTSTKSTSKKAKQETEE